MTHSAAAWLRPAPPRSLAEPFRQAPCVAVPNYVVLEIMDAAQSASPGNLSLGRGNHAQLESLATRLGSQKLLTELATFDEQDDPYDAARPAT